MKVLVRLFTVMLVAVSCQLANAQQTPPMDGRVALVVGNAAYPVSPLVNTKTDATAMADLLGRAGFKVNKQLDTSQASLRSAVESFGAQVRDPKVKFAIFYYAGHGIQVDWRNYLIPVDAKVRSVDDVRKQLVDVSELLRFMENTRNKSFLIILDACREDPFGDSFRAPNKGLSQFDAPVGSLLAYATAPGNVAQDGTGQNGLYTGYLLREFGVRDAKLEDAFKRVRLSVRVASRGTQIPWESTSLEEDLYLFPGEAKKLTDSERELMFDKEVSAWKRVKTSNDPNVLANFLREFPSGSTNELAQSRLNRLLRAQLEVVAMADSGTLTRDVKAKEQEELRAAQKAKAALEAETRAAAAAEQKELAQARERAAQEAKALQLAQAKQAKLEAAQAAAKQKEEQAQARLERLAQAKAEADARKLADQTAREQKQKELEEQRLAKKQEAIRLAEEKAAALAEQKAQALAQARERERAQREAEALAKEQAATAAEQKALAQARERAEREAARLADEQAKQEAKALAQARAKAEQEARAQAEEQARQEAKALAAEQAKQAKLQEEQRLAQQKAQAAELAEMERAMKAHAEALKALRQQQQETERLAAAQEQARKDEQQRLAAAQAAQEARKQAQLAAAAAEAAAQQKVAAQAAAAVAAPTTSPVPLAATAKTQVKFASLAPTPYYKGFNEHARRYSVGDEYRFRIIDQFNKSEKPLNLTVSRVDLEQDRVEYNGGEYISDTMGNTTRNDRGDLDTPRQFYPAELFIGKKWRTQFRQTRPNGTVYTFYYDMKVVARERVTVPAGSFDAYVLEGQGFNVNLGASLQRRIWVAPGINADIAHETFVRLRNGSIDQNDRQELVYYKAADQTGVAAR